MENYPAVNIFCELWPFGTYDPNRQQHWALTLVFRMSSQSKN